jgi:surface-anchored protein
VTANGAPPHGGSPFSDQGGPGGGSGGAILLMSPDLSLANQSVVSAAGGAGGSTTLDAGNGGGGGGGGRISLASTLSMSDVSFTATMPGFGGSGGSSGAAGHNGDGGSIDAEPFMTMTGPSSRQAGQSASFSASPAAGDASFAWDFGDGTSDTVQSPNHIFTVPGTYNVTVTATLTDSGKTATAHRSITITAPPSTGGGGGGAGGGGGNPQPQPPTPPQSRPQCVVPKLKGLSLSAARKKLTRAHCKLGKVKKPKLRKGTKKKPHLVVVKQPAANKAFPAGTKVNVTLGPKRPKRHHH